MSRAPKKKYEPTTKYFAIKNWEKYQAGKDRKGRDIKAWVKDYCGKDIDDPEYNSLTFFERYLFDALCRVRGRSGRNIYTDVTHIARACGAGITDRPHIGHALCTLISHGFLIPTNQEFSSSNSETHSESETQTETKVPPLLAAESPLPSGETKPPVGSLPNTAPTTTPKPASTDLRDWSETIPGCDLSPKRIADCIRYQLDVKKNDYFIKRLSRGYVLQEWKRLDRDTPEDYVYDPDPMIVEVVVPGVGDEDDFIKKDIRRRPKNDSERKLLQKNDRMIAHNRKWLYKKPCRYGCKEGLIEVPYPDNPRLSEHYDCKCIGE